MNPTVNYQYNDGGRKEAGFVGAAGDCLCRAAAIATRKPYTEIYNLINEVAKAGKKKSSARNGVYKQTAKAVLEGRLGLHWKPLMAIGTGCKVHLKSDELPETGAFILCLSKHYAAYVDGVLYDTHDSSRDGTRCVYGYWKCPC